MSIFKGALGSVFHSFDDKFFAILFLMVKEEPGVLQLMLDVAAVMAGVHGHLRPPSLLSTLINVPGKMKLPPPPASSGGQFAVRSILVSNKSKMSHHPNSNEIIAHATY